MDERVSQASFEQPTCDESRAWREQRQRAVGFLAAQRERLDEVEAQLASQIETIGSLLEAGLSGDAAQDDVERLRVELEHRQVELDIAQERAALELQTWSDQLRVKQDDVERRESELEELAVKLKQSQRSLAIGQEEYEAELEQLARRKLRFEEQQRRLDGELETIEHDREETRNQRRRIAEQLKQQKHSQFQELDLRRAELETLRVTLKQEADRNAQLLRQELDIQQAELEQQRRQLRLERAQFDAQMAEFEESCRQFGAARLQFDQLQVQHDGSHHTRSHEAETSLVQLQSEYERLQQHCHRQQEQIREYSELQVTQTGEIDLARDNAAHLQAELQRSQELAQAVEHELSSLRSAYEQLREELAARAAAPPTVVIDQAQVEQLTVERDSLRQRFDELEGELSATNARYFELHKSLQAQLAATDAELHRAAADTQQAAAAAETIALLTNERDALIRELAENEAIVGQVGRQQAALLELAAERDQLQARQIELETELAQSRVGQEQAEVLARERTELATRANQTEIALRTLEAQLAATQSVAPELSALHAERDALKLDLERANAELLLARSAADRLASIENERYTLAARLADMERQAQSGAHENIVRERDELLARVQDAEQQLAVALAQAAPCAVDPAEARKVEDLQRRFELAVDDVRSLKKRNAELEDQLSALKANRLAPPDKSAGGQDWESMKRKMLAELEAEGDPTDPKRKEERLSIENTIRITDDIVGQKDHEIADLRKLLEEQSDNLGSMAVGAAAIAAALDQDELIQQERERLRAAQAEWREKLRQAEIDVSLERARIARERSELEDKLSQVESERAQFQTRGSGGAPGSAGDLQKPQRGRWLERLGLKESDREKK